jgi:transmembrane sensor
MMSMADIEARAARWLLRREEPDWSETDEAALDAWLAEATAHRIAFYRLELGWRKADRLAALSRPVGRGARTWISRWRSAVIAASIAAAAGIAGVLWIQPLGPTRYTTDVGAHRTVTLADGSQVQLNTATRLRASIDHDARTVWLDSGEAYFEVTHLAGRPFVVHAGDRRVTVLGTKFSVRRSGSEVKVTVLEGRVRVEGPGGSGGMQQAVVDPGAELLAQGVSTVVVKAGIDKVATELSWRSGILSFEGTSLGDAVAEFNRYSTERIIVDSNASGVRIGGVFDASNAEGFVRLLHEAYGLQVERSGDQIRISE